MREAAANLEFETAARLRDEIRRLKLLELKFANDLTPPPATRPTRPPPSGCAPKPGRRARPGSGSTAGGANPALLGGDAWAFGR